MAVATVVVDASAARRAPQIALEPIAINDNRVVAGTHDGDRVTITSKPGKANGTPMRNRRQPDRRPGRSASALARARQR
jgi:hypothetical protein